MGKCVHCWHDFERPDAREQAGARGEAWIRRMSRLAEEQIREPDVAELSLVFCCKCGESRFDHRRLPVLRSYRG